MFHTYISMSFAAFFYKPPGEDFNNTFDHYSYHHEVKQEYDADIEAASKFFFVQYCCSCTITFLSSMV